MNKKVPHFIYGITERCWLIDQMVEQFRKEMEPGWETQEILGPRPDLTDTQLRVIFYSALDTLHEYYWLKKHDSDT